MNVVFTLAVGDKSWGQKALNLCLSVKAANPKAKTALIHTASAIEGIEEYVNAYFDFTLQIGDEENPIQQAFKTKTEFYDLITGLVPDAESYLFMDADTIMLSGRSVDEFFNELKDVDFTMWCNDVYDFATKTRMRDDYTFWCEPEDVILKDQAISRVGGKMPQVNSSFIYFKKAKIVELIFLTAKQAFGISDIEIKKYKGVVPDEFCFNVALAHTQKLPHQIPYYPIFFSFASEHFEEQYIRNWKAIGFAGDSKQHENVVHLYNHNVAYFRKEFDVPAFELSTKTLEQVEEIQMLQIKPISRRTLFRRGEVENSDGGIFNPDGFYDKRIGYVVIFRKEANMDFYENGHSQATAIPHLHILGDKELSFELTLYGIDKNVRLEDFRVVENSFDGNSFLVSHTAVTGNLTDKMKAKMFLSVVDISKKELCFLEEPTLPIECGKIEKNWVFFIEDGCLYCIYSLSPYQLFAQGKDGWKEVVTEPTIIDFPYGDERICNSTKPVLIGNEYVMLFHTKTGKNYFHGACVVDKQTKKITHYTKQPIHFPFTGEGWQRGLLYISGAYYIVERNLLRITAGEGDTNSIRWDFDATEFLNLIKNDRAGLN